MAIIKDGFELYRSTRDLEGCDDPLVFDFVRELLEPGLYTIAAGLTPSGDFAQVTLEVF